jgi:hypothetical protein
MPFDVTVSAGTSGRGEEIQMRVMVLVMAGEERDPSEHVDEFEAMGKFNEELVRAGVILAGEGLAPTSQGKRLVFPGPGDGGGGARVLDGPFTEAKEMVGGFWIWQVSSMEEAVEWLKRAPFRGQTVDLRRIMEPADFAGQVPQEIMDAEARLRAQTSTLTVADGS